MASLIPVIEKEMDMLTKDQYPLEMRLKQMETMCKIAKEENIVGNSAKRRTNEVLKSIWGRGADHCLLFFLCIVAPLSQTSIGNNDSVETVQTLLIWWIEVKIHYKLRAYFHIVLAKGVFEGLPRVITPCGMGDVVEGLTGDVWNSDKGEIIRAPLPTTSAAAFIRNFGVEAAVIEFQVNKDIGVVTLTKEGAKHPVRVYFAISDWQEALRVGKRIAKEWVEKESTDKENTDEENTDEENMDEENMDEENMDEENMDEENTDEENTGAI